ncbi:MAG: GNAT family N-acetyltransferase [Chloroflexi bacterium]|nr:GNAT family N-acetyltransferase [Chloroflexota bacterium]
MVVSVLNPSETLPGPRPLHLSRDLNAVVDLLEVAFEEDLGPTDRAILEEMRQLRFFAPFISLFGRALPSLGDLFSGFVWEEDRRIVGNVTVTRMGTGSDLHGGDTGVWLVTNVATAPAYRRRGIARALMETAIVHARQRGGRAIALQVRQDNAAALALYRDMGFAFVDASCEMEWPAPRGVMPQPLQVEGYSLRPWSQADAGQVQNLIHMIQSPEARRMGFTVEGAVRSGVISHMAEGVSDVLLGRHRFRWCVSDGRSIQAVAELRASFGWSRHRLLLIIHPDMRGQVEGPLIATTLSALERYPSRRVFTEIDADLTEARQVLKAYGFRELRCLDRLILPL